MLFARTRTRRRFAVEEDVLLPSRRRPPPTPPSDMMAMLKLSSTSKGEIRGAVFHNGDHKHHLLSRVKVVLRHGVLALYNASKRSAK